MDTIHNVYRSSCALIALERGLEPLRDAIARITPEIESMVKERNTHLIDYDSYRRRVKGYKEKQQQYEENGKSTTTAAQENLAEITKFENKEKNAKETYEDKNYKTKQELLKAKDQHDRIMDDLLIATVVSQAELFARAAKELEDVLSLLPPERVRENTFWFVSFFNHCLTHFAVVSFDFFFSLFEFPFYLHA
jgi:chromosome segregation ATPase